jgi:hypothetical protein
MTRKITFKEFYECLQREYIVALIRGQIYLHKKDKDYYNLRESVKKKQTIVEISSRNNLPSIFNDKLVKERFLSEMLSEWGLPHFVYRSSTDRLQRRPKDVINYFQKGLGVLVKMPNGETQEGRIVYTYITGKNTVMVQTKEGTFDFFYENVSRSLKIEI